MPTYLATVRINGTPDILEERVTNRLPGWLADFGVIGATDANGRLQSVTFQFAATDMKDAAKALASALEGVAGAELVGLEPADTGHRASFVVQVHIPLRGRDVDELKARVREVVPVERLGAPLEPDTSRQRLGFPISVPADSREDAADAARQAVAELDSEPEVSVLRFESPTA